MPLSCKLISPNSGSVSCGFVADVQRTDGSLAQEIDLQTELLIRNLEVCVVVHPYGQVVNSVIVARIK